MASNAIQYSMKQAKQVWVMEDYKIVSTQKRTTVSED